eukprot:3701118-Rhodomonas_salina.3
MVYAVPGTAYAVVLTRLLTCWQRGGGHHSAPEASQSDVWDHALRARPRAAVSGTSPARGC